MVTLTKPALLALLSALGAAAWKDQCESFTASIPNVVIKPTYYPAGALVNLTSPSSSVTTTKMPAFCSKYQNRISGSPLTRLLTGLALTITTNATSGNQALTEVWMPDDWNNRLLGFGNGGLSGGGMFSLCQLYRPV
jgi:feruloyl esterase